jgi:phenylpropionate dioxygenase-like ring-hydroxylating dioxygenase large terminal subunit
VTLTNGNYFDRENGLLDRAAYHDQGIFDRELETIFARTWMFVGHESQVPNPNDFFASRMGLDNVVLTRDRQGEIHVLLNTCRHKGMRVVRYDEGNTSVFTCPYHAWSYSTDGKIANVPGQLVGVQAYQEAYCRQLDKVQWGLVNARVQVYKGAVFATWDQDGPSFEEYLGDMRLYLDALLDAQDGSEGGTEVVPGVMKWRLQANWKACSENFVGDPLHGVSHRSVEIANIGPGGVEGASRHGMEAKRERLPWIMVTFEDTGHGILSTPPYEVTEANADIFPRFEKAVGPHDKPDVLDGWFREAAARRPANSAGRLSTKMYQSVGGIFPNMSFHTMFPRTIAVWHPIAPGVTEGWRWCVVDKSAPQEVKDNARHHFMRYSGPTGMTEQDDMENWSYLTAATRGPIARRYPYNYQAGLHGERADPALRDATVSDIKNTELSLRGFYAAWQRHLQADNWAEMSAAGVAR